jgi:hypothetical protein
MDHRLETFDLRPLTSARAEMTRAGVPTPIIAPRAEAEPDDCSILTRSGRLAVKTPSLCLHIRRERPYAGAKYREDKEFASLCLLLGLVAPEMGRARPALNESTIETPSLLTSGATNTAPRGNLLRKLRLRPLPLSFPSGGLRLQRKSTSGQCPMHSRRTHCRASSDILAGRLVSVGLTGLEPIGPFSLPVSRLITWNLPPRALTCGRACVTIRPEIAHSILVPRELFGFSYA